MGFNYVNREICRLVSRSWNFFQYMKSYDEKSAKLISKKFKGRSFSWLEQF